MYIFCKFFFIQAKDERLLKFLASRNSRKYVFTTLKFVASSIAILCFPFSKHFFLLTLVLPWRRPFTFCLSLTSSESLRWIICVVFYESSSMPDTKILFSYLEIRNSSVNQTATSSCLYLRFFPSQYIKKQRKFLIPFECSLRIHLCKIYGEFIVILYRFIFPHLINPLRSV